MNIKTAIAISVASALILITPVLAEDSTSTAKPTTQQRVDTRIQKIDTKIAQIRTNIQQKVAELEQRKLTEASKAAMFRQKLEERRLKIASHEAEIKLKIQAFKDKQKAEIAARVNTNLNKINQIQTDQMLRNLDLMSSLLDKLADRSSANQAIVDAREAIANARTAVEAQAQKDYTIAVTTETKIRLDAQAKRDQLHSDILAVRKLVIDAKQAVSNAVRVAKSDVGSSPKGKEATPSGQR